MRGGRGFGGGPRLAKACPDALDGGTSGCQAQRPQAQTVDPTEVPNVAGDEVEVVVQGGRSDLEICFGESAASIGQTSGKLPVHLGDLDVERQDRHRWKDAVTNHREVALMGRGAMGTEDQLADRDGAGELLVARDGAEPSDVRRVGTSPERFADGVGVEEIGHGQSTERRCRGGPRR